MSDETLEKITRDAQRVMGDKPPGQIIHDIISRYDIGVDLTLENANGVPVWVTPTYLDDEQRRALQEKIGKNIAEGKYKTPILTGDKYQTIFTQGGTCWACEQHGSDLVWWNAMLYEDGQCITNRRLGYLIHRECKKLAEAKIDADYQGRVRHDGKLDENAYIAYGEIRELAFKQGLRLFNGSVICDLTAKQALSLLLWLMQERPRLEKMAWEVKEGDDAH